MNDAPVSDTSLIAVEARTEDIGRGILRVDPEAMQAMDLRSGDTVEIAGERTALARLLPNFPPDRGKREAHLDGITRGNAGISLGPPGHVASAALQAGGIGDPAAGGGSQAGGRATSNIWRAGLTASRCAWATDSGSCCSAAAPRNWWSNAPNRRAPSSSSRARCCRSRRRRRNRPRAGRPRRRVRARPTWAVTKMSAAWRKRSSACERWWNCRSPARNYSPVLGSRRRAACCCTVRPAPARPCSPVPWPPKPAPASITSMARRSSTSTTARQRSQAAGDFRDRAQVLAGHHLHR